MSTQELPQIVATSTGGTNYEPCPAGNHVARCVSMVHIGTIEENYQGETKFANKVRLTWELPNERKVFHEEKGEQPYVLSKDFTLSMHEKANLRKALESWRGKAFTEKEAEAFNITVLLGKPCMLNVIWKEKKDGNMRADIAGITAMPKGIPCPPQENPTTIFTINSPDWDMFDTLPDFLKGKIRESNEFKAMLKANVPVSSAKSFPDQKVQEPANAPEDLFAEPGESITTESSEPLF